jgi:hypothetical protein
MAGGCPAPAECARPGRSNVGKLGGVGNSNALENQTLLRPRTGALRLGFAALSPLRPLRESLSSARDLPRAIRGRHTDFVTGRGPSRW